VCATFLAAAADVQRPIVTIRLVNRPRKTDGNEDQLRGVIPGHGEKDLLGDGGILRVALARGKGDVHRAPPARAGADLGHPAGPGVVGYWYVEKNTSRLDS